MARSDPDRPLADQLAATRALTLALAAPLSDADATIQPHPDASPAKWHLAHTTWFFETFVLRDHVPGYRLHDERWAYLFNSYYNGEGDRHAREHAGHHHAHERGNGHHQLRPAVRPQLADLTEAHDAQRGGDDDAGKDRHGHVLDHRCEHQED